MRCRIGGDAPWIWDRIDRVIELAGLSKRPIGKVLDCCHVLHPLSQALASLGPDSEAGHSPYQQYRNQLRNGQWKQVFQDLDSSSFCVNQSFGLFHCRHVFWDSINGFV